MTEAQIQRYARHVLLPDVGGVGQRRLLGACVAIDVCEGDAAAGYVLAFVAAAGIGRLRLRGAVYAPVTDAEVRHGALLGTDDIGQPRGAALARALTSLNPDVKVVLDDGTGVTKLPREPESRAERLCEHPIEITLVPRTRDAIDALIDGAAAAARVIAWIARGRP